MRTIALVNCLARLHNFCNNEVERTKEKELDEDALPTDIEHMTNGPEGFFRAEFQRRQEKVILVMIKLLLSTL